MILQCDQCNTRFRLDDAKLKPGGVKVRCSKCRHVFLAGADFKQEESEFDAILSGLGAPASEAVEKTAGSSFVDAPGTAHETPAGPGAAAAPAYTVPAPQPDGERASRQGAADFAASDFPDEAFEPPEKPAREQADFSAFDAVPELPPQQETPPTRGEQGLDYDEFAFEDEPAAPKEELVPAPGEALDFDEFSFPAEPASKNEEPRAAGSEPSGFGEFSFDEEPALKQEEPPSARVEAPEFDEFSFAEEPAVQKEEPATPTDEAPEFDEFSFAEESAVKKEEPVTATDEVSGFGEFSFAEEPAVKQAEPATATDEVSDFGEFSFAEEPAVKQEEPAAGADEVSDFGEFGFIEEPAVKQEEPAAAAADDVYEFGDFSLSEEPPVSKELPAADALGGFDFSALPEDLPSKPGEAPAADDDFSFGELSFPDDLSAKPVEQEPAVAAPLTDAGTPEPPPFLTSSTPKPLNGEAALDFGFAETQVSSRAPDEFEDEDLLPSLSIASRRKERSLLTISIVVISVLVIVALSGAGFYLLQSGPAAFDKLGLGFVAKWFGMESVEDGRVTIRNPLAAFYQNKEAGEIFVVTGEAVNSFRKARASIHVKVSLFDKNGAVLLQKTAYCGNRLTKEQLASLPMAKIESIMNNQFGDSLANLGVQPGSAIGFVVAIANVPKEAADFGVEVLGSTVAGK